jgi:hypothetical protein
MVDERRIEELIERRQRVGLTDDEADELGRLFAEKEGKPYSNAKLTKMAPGEPAVEVPAEATQTLQQPPEPRPTDVASQEPESPSP